MHSQFFFFPCWSRFMWYLILLLKTQHWLTTGSSVDTSSPTFAWQGLHGLTLLLCSVYRLSEVWNHSTKTQMKIAGVGWCKCLMYIVESYDPWFTPLRCLEFLVKRRHRLECLEFLCTKKKKINFCAFCKIVQKKFTFKNYAFQFNIKSKLANVKETCRKVLCWQGENKNGHQNPAHTTVYQKSGWNFAKRIKDQSRRFFTAPAPQNFKRLGW